MMTHQLGALYGQAPKKRTMASLMAFTMLFPLLLSTTPADAAAKKAAAKKPAATKSLPLQKTSDVTPSLDLGDPNATGRITPLSELDGSNTQAKEPPQLIETQSRHTKGKEAELDNGGLTPASALEPEARPAQKVQAPADKNIKPVSYSPLGAIVVFPVVKHAREKAFGDLPLVFSREFSLRMESKAPDTRILNPIYTVDELRLRGLGHIYDKVMAYYLKAGRPEPLALDYLLKQLSVDGRPISRVVFVEADLDMTHPGDPTGVHDRLKAWMTDDVPKQMKYHIESRVQVFDSEQPDYPMVWGFSWRHAVKANEMYNVSPSVYADSDSHQTFARASRVMSREMLFVMPKHVYLQPEFDMSVQGKLLSKQDGANNSTANAPLSPENQQAVERILQQKN